MDTLEQLINEIYEDNYSHLDLDENMGGESCNCFTPSGPVNNA